MFSKKLTLLSIIFLSLSISVYPQQSESGKFELETRRNKKVTIPFKLVNNLVVFPLFINGSDTLNFVLDTGVGATLITELSEENSVSLQYLRTINISGLGEGESVEVFYSTGNTIQVGKAIGVNQEVLVMKEDVFHLSGLLGVNVNGLIGYSLFKDFIVEIDYRLKNIVLHDYDRYSKKYEEKKRSERWTTLPITLFRQKPYINVEITQHNDRTKNVKLLLDSGASHGMALYHTASDEIILPPKTIRSFLGSGISGEIHGYLGRISSLNFDKYELKNIVAAYPDEEGIKRALINSERDGSIGAEVLRRFKIFINYRDESMVLRSSSGYSDEFSYNIGGLELATPYPNLPIFLVSHVRDSSAAQKAGILEGDILLEINRKGSQHYDLNKLNYLFQNDGKRIRLKILRDDKILRKQLVLRDELN